MKLYSQLLCFSLLLLNTSAIAQLVVNNGFTAQQLGNNLAGNNVNVFNASISGNAVQYGTFNFTGSGLGLNSGVIMSTGNIFNAVGPNNSNGTSSNLGGPGNADLTALAGFNTHDAVVFEFDFEVQGDEIEFNFVFLSEEYNEYVNSGFNDVFAFYISGPGITGQENLAVVPGTTTPVTINTINNGSFWQFFNDNTNASVNIEFDGFTTLMTAKKTGLQQCGVYTLSLRLADGSDFALDSGVLLEENSLIQSNISASSSTFSANNTALEGCIEASFTFQLDSIMPNDVIIPIGVGGSATNGVDYNQIDTLIIIPAGQTAATIIIDAIADGLTEGTEVIELFYTPSPCEPPDTVLLYIDDYTPLEYTVDPTDVSCNGYANGMVDINVSGGIAPYTLTLTDSITGDQISYTNFPVTGLDVGTYYVEIIDGYGCTAEDIVAGSLFDAGQTFIPDGQGGSYQSTINLSGFGASQTINSPNQIQSVCATMEHSRIGELLITLTAPDGTEVILKEQPGGAVCNFGEPCAVGPADGGQGNTNINPGIGYNYCWQNISTYGTMVSEANNFTYTYTNICDGSQQSDKYLPSGSYQPYESFSNFVGTPLNGGWTIEITDQIPNNNGYIFDWSISLQADIPDSVFTITQPDAPVISDAVVEPDCGASNGSINLTVSGGFPPFTYLWSNGATTQDISGLSAGSYTVDVTDDSLCVYSYQVDLSNNGLLSISGVVSNEVCADANDGVVNVSVSNAAAPINYSWSNGATSEDVSNLAPGNYTITVSDGSGCQGIGTFAVGAAPNINLSADITNENCGDEEGIINLTALGVVNPVSYNWSNGEITQDIDELGAGNYTVSIVDGNGCTASATYTIINLVGNCVPDCDLAITSSSVNNETCGNNNGGIDLTVFTTNGPVLTSWSNGSSSVDLTNLTQGTYTVTLTDNEGCIETQSYTIQNVTSGLAITSIFATNEFCGNNQGAANATISGGALPYSYSWSNGAGTEDINGINAGTYTLTVTDANNCATSQSINIVNDAGTLNLVYGNAVNEICGNSEGSIDIIISGGQPPYTYSWNSGQTSQDLIDIPAGSYQCEITDNNGCSITTPVYVVENLAGNLTISDINLDNEVCSNTLGKIELTISGGTAPLTYSWNTGASTEDIFNLSAGTYSATISDASGCSVSTGNLIVLNESGTLNLAGVSSFDELCGNGTGSINITTTGGAAPLMYQWSTGSTSQDLSNLSAGNYDCVITDANGCEVFASATIQNDPGILNVDNIIVTNENCGQSDGALNLIISGAAAPVSYLWNSGATSQDLSNIPAGSYTVNIVDNNGCSTSGAAIVNNDAGTLNLVNAQVFNEVCNAANGSIDISVAGGLTPLTFAWSNGASTEDISGLSAGSYTCTITDNNGCAIVAGPYTINNSSGGMNLTLASVTNESCSNGLGAISVNTVGGTAPYTYSWSSGQSTEDISGITAGTYILTATGALGCQQTLTVNVTNDPGTLSIASLQITDENCGNNNGAINLGMSGGAPTYSYLWSTGATTQNISGLSAGTYSVTISDQNNCIVSNNSIVVNNNSGNFVVTGINVVDENCSNNAGNVDLIVSGGSTPISYVWSNGTNTQDLVGVSAGSYSGTATDINGCVVSFSATINNDPGNLVATSSNTSPTCGSSNGAIDLNITGGTVPFTYLWSTGATSQDLTNLSAGSYTCNIVDNGGCFTNFTTNVNDLGSPAIVGVAITDETCNQSNGEISISVQGGSPTYVYSWSGPPATPCCTYTLDMDDLGNSWNGASVTVILDGVTEGTYTVPGGGANVETFDVCGGQQIQLSWTQGAFDNEVSFNLLDGSGNIVFSQGPSPSPGIIYTGTANCTPPPMDGPTITGLSAGVYTVYVTDQNGCQDSLSMTVQNSSGTLQIADAVLLDESCSDANGAIDLTLSGTGPYTVSWNTGATTQDLTGLVAGSYTVNVSNPLGCVVTETYTLNNLTNGLGISNAIVLDENCGSSDGSIDITPVGGAGPLSYAWSNGYTAQDIAGLSAGTYTVSISDGSACDYAQAFTIVNNANGMAASAAVTNANCGAANGSINLTVSGGTAPYTFDWSNGASAEDLTGLTGGSYTCIISDFTGCEYPVTVQVLDGNGGLSLSAVVTNENCGNNNGAVNLSVVGGTAPITYVWSNGASTQDINGLEFGVYSVTVTGANGCTATASYIVESAGTFNYTSVVTNENCGNGTGNINMTFTGFGQPNNFSWSSGQTTADINNLSEGWYVLTMWNTFGGGCTMVDSFYVGNNQGTLTIDQMLLTQESCTQANGAIDAVISGGTAPYNYAWNTGATSQDLTGIPAGTYTLTVTDNVGCSTSGSATIVNSTFGFGISSALISDEFCGNGSGAIDITINGGSTPYTYSWSNGSSTEDLTGLSAGTYTLTVTDNANCVNVTSFDVENETNGFTASIASITDEACGTQNGAVDLEISGGISPVSYAWSNGALTQDLSGIAGGTYSCAITDNTGCTVSISADVQALSGNFSVGTPVLQNELCGDGNGSITLNPTGGTGALTYSWGGVTPPCCSYTLNMYDLNNNGWGGNPLPVVVVSVNGTQVGSYGVPVGTGNSFATQNIPVCNGDQISFAYQQSAQNQNNTYEVVDSYGNVVFTDGPNPFNGVAYTSTVSCPGANVNSQSGLSAGTYTVEITDNIGCVLQDTFVVINGSNGLMIDTAVLTNALCAESNGGIDLFLSTGTAPYTFDWNTGASSEDLSSIVAGTYDVVITDGDGCQTSGVYTLSADASNLNITGANITNEYCAQGNGVIDLGVAGDLLPFIYTWSNGASTEDQSGLSAGTYDILVEDSAGCQVNATYTVGTDISNLSITGASITDDLCEQGNGAIDVNVTGDLLPLVYTWSNGAASQDLTGLSPGTYDLTVEDSAGCQVNTSYTVLNTVTLVILNASQVSNASCITCTDGSIDLTMGVAGAPYTYAWSTGATTEDVSNLTPGTYSVTVTNADGCDSVFVFDVLNAAGLGDLNGASIALAPNPAQDVVTIYFSQIPEAGLQLEMSDALGKLIRSVRSDDLFEGQWQLDVHDLAPGTYTLRLTSGQYSTVKRLVIQR